MTLHIIMGPLTLQVQVQHPRCSMQIWPPWSPTYPWTHLKGCCQDSHELQCGEEKTGSTFGAISQQHLHLEACDIQDGHVDKLEGALRDLRVMHIASGRRSQQTGSHSAQAAVTAPQTGRLVN